MMGDCSKRNCMYEIWCITCEEREKERIMNEEDTEKAKDKIRNMKIHKYIGESHRSGYERGFEHLDKLTSLAKDSHMLKHVIINHEDEDLSSVRFGMKIIGFYRSSFERQMSEAVTINQEKDIHEILNSKGEFNACELPRLTTRLGEQESQEWERIARKERKDEEIIEEKINKMRKERNKARLRPEKTTLRSNKRMKTSEEDYISVREIWGPPGLSEQKKNELEEDEKKENVTENKRIRIDETKTYKEDKNDKIDKTKDKTIKAQESGKEELLEKDWDKILIEHRKDIEKEVLEDNEKDRDLEEEKNTGWSLYEECKAFLEENDQK